MRIYQIIFCAIANNERILTLASEEVFALDNLPSTVSTRNINSVLLIRAKLLSTALAPLSISFIWPIHSEKENVLTLYSAVVGALKRWAATIFIFFYH